MPLRAGSRPYRRSARPPGRPSPAQTAFAMAVRASRPRRRAPESISSDAHILRHGLESGTYVGGSSAFFSLGRRGMWCKTREFGGGPPCSSSGALLASPSFASLARGAVSRGCLQLLRLIMRWELLSGCFVAGRGTGSGRLLCNHMYGSVATAGLRGERSPARSAPQAAGARSSSAVKRSEEKTLHPV